MDSLLKVLILISVVFFDVQACEIIIENAHQRLIHSPQTIERIKSPYAGIPIISAELISSQLPIAYIEIFGKKCIQGRPYEVETHGMNVESLHMGEKKVLRGEEDKLLYTSGICDCIGISVWDPLSSSACLYHVSKMELRESVHLFQEFLDEIKGFSENSSSLEINLASCYWSEDLIQVLDLFRAQGLCISGLYVPNALMEYSDKLNIFIDKEITPAAYFFRDSFPFLAMTLNTSTGKTGIHPNW